MALRPAEHSLKLNAEGQGHELATEPSKSVSDLHRVSQHQHVGGANLVSTFRTALRDIVNCCVLGF